MNELSLTFPRLITKVETPNNISMTNFNPSKVCFKALVN